MMRVNGCSPVTPRIGEFQNEKSLHWRELDARPLDGFGLDLSQPGSKAGAEPTPLGGCEKFVIKFPLHASS